MSSASLTIYLNWRKEPPLFRQFPPVLPGFPGERGHLRTANHPPILLFWGQGISGGGPWDKPSVYFPRSPTTIILFPAFSRSLSKVELQLPRYSPLW